MQVSAPGFFPGEATRRADDKRSQGNLADDPKNWPYRQAPEPCRQAGCRQKEMAYAKKSEHQQNPLFEPIVSQIVAFVNPAPMAKLFLLLF
jgi:hypothetical protein